MNSRSDLQLMDLHLATLFVRDADGRLRYNNEPGYAEAELEPAPRFFMGRTAEGNVWGFRHDLPDDLVGQLEQLCRSEPVAANPTEPPMHAAAIRTALQAHASITHEQRGPAYRIPDNIQAPAAAVLISEANAHLLEDNFPWTRILRGQFQTIPVTAVIVGNRAVSICHCSRLTSLAAEAGVKTVESERGRGYASAAVAAWAAAVLQRGLVPLYSTWWENMASQSIARKLGMVGYGEDWSIT